MEAQERTTTRSWSYWGSTFFSLLTAFFIIWDWAGRKPQDTEHCVALLLMVFGCWFCYHQLQAGLQKISQSADYSEVTRLFNAADGLVFLANSVILTFCIRY
jgi:hypothetical protein